MYMLKWKRLIMTRWQSGGSIAIASGLALFVTGLALLSGTTFTLFIYEITFAKIVCISTTNALLYQCDTILSVSILLLSPGCRGLFSGTVDVNETRNFTVEHNPNGYHINYNCSFSVHIPDSGFVTLLFDIAQLLFSNDSCENFIRVDYFDTSDRLKSTRFNYYYYNYY
mgnify:CR=1 FL=1